MTGSPIYQRGDVVLVDLEPVTGSEQGRKRPCIVMSDLQVIRTSGSRPLYFVVPLTTATKLSGPLAPQLLKRPGGLPADSTALVMHARAIDPARVVNHWGAVDAADVAVLQKALHTLVH